jgi:hypothetical protein
MATAWWSVDVAGHEDSSLVNCPWEAAWIGTGSVWCFMSGVGLLCEWGGFADDDDDDDGDGVHDHVHLWCLMLGEVGTVLDELATGRQWWKSRKEGILR